MESTLTVEDIRGKKKHTLFTDLIISLVKTKPLGTVGGIIVLVMFFTGIFADFIAPYDSSEVHLMDTLKAPCSQYLLGTDNMGRDLLSRVIHGARISMIVGLAGSALSVAVGTLIGGISGFMSGKTDTIIQRFVDAFMCFPPIFLMLTVMSLLGPGIGPIIFVVGIQGGIRQSRVVRSAVIGIKENTYFQAAIAIGSPSWRTFMKHVMPNIMAPIIIIFTLSMGQMILIEATLSFLGFGIPPPTPSWGGMLSGSGRSYMYMAPWMVIWPGLALSIVVYGINMLGDAVRDILDPRLRGGLGRYGRAVKQKIKVKKEDVPE
jgi:peptide/nickel transport system permease protein